MPTISVTDPKGRVWDVNAPEGATEHDAIDYVKGQIQQERANKFSLSGDVSQAGKVERFAGGAKHAWDRAALGVKGLFTDLSPEDKEQLEQGKAFVEKGDIAANLGEIGGDILITAPAGGLAGRAVGLGARVLPRALAALTRGGAELASSAGIGAVTNPEDRATGAISSAAGAGLGMGVNRLIGGVARPLVSEAAERLMGEGVQPTVGQSIGGLASKTEEKLASWPVVGGAISRARERAQREFNERAIQQAVPGVRGVGDQALSEARDAISSQYDAALSQLPRRIQVDPNSVVQAANRAATNARNMLSDDSVNWLNRYVNQNIVQRAQNITPEVAKRIESDLGAQVRSLMSSPEGERRALGDALSQIHQQWRASLTGIANAVNPQAGAALREADAAWRAFLPVDKAAAFRGAQSAEIPGQFTPSHLRRAIAAQDTSAGDRATRYMTQGNTPFERLNILAREGEQVLGNRVPDSGTAARMLTGGAWGGAAVSGQLPAMLTGWIAANAGASRLGQQAVTQGLEPTVRRLLGSGMTADQVVRIAQERGPEALIALGRSMGMANAMEEPKYAPQ